MAIPVIFTFLAARPDGATIREMLWPVEQGRRLVAIAFWAPLLLPIAGALAGGFDLTSLWSMPSWTLLPVLLLSPPAVKVHPVNQRRILATAIGEPLAMLIAAPMIAIIAYRLGVTPPADDRLLAAETERLWHQVTSQTLRFVGCDAADEVIAYAADRPRSLPLRSYRGDIADEVYADARGWPPEPGGVGTSNADLAQSGMALVCSASKLDWVQAAATQAARQPSSRRINIEVTRTYLGIRGQPQHYIIFIIPPQP